MRKSLLSLLSVLIVIGCTETVNMDNDELPWEPEQVQAQLIAVQPDSILIDSLTSVGLGSFIKYSVDLRVQNHQAVPFFVRTILENGNGNKLISTHSYDNIQSSPFVLTIIDSFAINGFNVISPVSYLTIGPDPKFSTQSITPLLTFKNISGPSVAIDSIIFSPPEEAQLGIPFSITVYTNHLLQNTFATEVNVTGIRPDGTDQSPFQIPVSEIPGRFYLQLNVPVSSQTGLYTWTFRAKDGFGQVSKPVIKSYRLTGGL